MIFYFDTSAIVPLVVAETSSHACHELWAAAPAVASSRLSFVEASTALAAARRRGCLDQDELQEAGRRLSLLWSMVHVVEVDESLMRAAADAAHRHALRGYDAVQFASASRLVASGDLVAVSRDAGLLAAWLADGVDVANVQR